MGKGKLIDAIFSEKCEHSLVQPTFIIDYPTETSPLTKMHRSKPGLTERFELFINCKEIANAYSELNDPVDQMERFQDQLKLSEKGDDEAMFIDQDFVRALEYGMPPTSGMGMGIDRLTMLLTNQSSIPAEWIDPLRKLGFTTINKLREVEKHTKLHQDLCGFNKKNKLGLQNPTQDEVKAWLENK